MTEPQNPNGGESELERLTRRWNAPWLATPEDVLGIKDVQLRKTIMSIGTRPDGLNTSSTLGTEYLTLERKINEELIDRAEAETWLPFIQNEFEFRLQIENSSVPPLQINLPDRTPSIEQPLHIGAAIIGGRREMYIVDRGLIDAVDIGNESGRRDFIFKNLFAFNYLYLKSSEMSSSWLAVIKDWEADVNVAQAKTGVLTTEVRSEFDTQLKAAMAITASARAIEISGGSFTSYAIALTGVGDGGKGPNPDWQDKNVKYLLHADPEKIRVVLSDPMVRAYYERLIGDAGLARDPNTANIEDDPFLEWGPQQQPNRLKIEKPYFQEPNGTSRFLRELRENSPLVRFLKNSAEQGGFDGYIDEVLLDGIDRSSHNFEVEKAAAKLACDIFLVDKWTRWEDLITEGDAGISSKLSLQPCGEFAGDPLKAIIKPTFLPRLKGVYTGPDEVVLDVIDLAFRPIDIYTHISENNVVLYDSPVDYKTRLPVPSMVTNLKTLIRYNSALDKFFGGPMAANVPSWTSQTMSDLVGPGGTFDLIDQVFGAQKIKVPVGTDPNVTRDFEIGKHIAGDISMRILYAKALALSLESSKPGFAQKMQILFDPSGKTRPNLEILTILAGPNLDGNRGLIKSIQGGRLDFVVGNNNVFKARKYYDQMINILQTDDQTGSSSANVLNGVGFILDASTAIANAFGLIGSRR